MEIDGFNPTIITSSNDSPAETFTLTGFFGGCFGVAAQEGAEEIGEYILGFAAGALLGGGVPAGVWGLWKLGKWTYRILSSD